MKSKLLASLMALMFVFSFASPAIAAEVTTPPAVSSESVDDSDSQLSISPFAQRTYSTTYPTYQGPTVTVYIPDSQGVYKPVTLNYYGTTADGWYGYAGLYDY